MPGHPNRLGKAYKLCSITAIDSLFSGRAGGADVCSALAYPLRAVWRRADGRAAGAPVQFVISVPKRRLRHAVDRVTMRRRIREAFRLNRHSFEASGVRADVAYVYVGDKVLPYAAVERAMRKLLTRMLQWEQ